MFIRCREARHLIGNKCVSLLFLPEYLTDRARIGAFKKVWADFDTDRSGYIRRKDFVRFFSVRSASRCWSTC